MNYLNLGCGSRFHKDWVNLDKHPTNSQVQKYDIQHGIPFPENTFDMVYHSHLLEHLSLDKVSSFTKECFRVLKPGGILRVVVPDLEQISRLYLLAFENSLIGDPDWQQKYDWIILELFDQVGRNFPGGKMLQYLQQDNLPDKEFIISRIGHEAINIFNTTNIDTSQVKKKNNFQTRLLKIPSIFREFFTKFLLGQREYNALQIGRFRLGGEVHYWMYDRYSLQHLLRKVGFQKINIRTAYDSTIHNWQEFHLDTDEEGNIFKPDSLYVEAIKIISHEDPEH